MRRSYNIPGDVHGLTFTCFKSRKSLSFKRTRHYLADSIQSARRSHDFKVLGWVFMPGHVHLVIRPMRADYSIADIMRSIKQPVAQRTINHLRKVKSPSLRQFEVGVRSQKHRFWQNGGGYDRNFRNKEELLAFIDYAHNNPVSAGLVQNQTDWEWSSAREWLLGVKGIIPIDKDAMP